jgi:uncharacterized protein (DUF305 family)
MTTLMIAVMAITMLLLMWKMYPNLKVNLFILLFAATTFGGTLFLLRTQAFVSIQYMKAMIPHHSSAIMTSSNVDFKDPEAKKIAEDIAAQEKEIKQMNDMITRLESEK